jgi:hypothetical protein
MAHHEAALPKCTQVDSSTLQLDLPLHQEEEVGALHSKEATGSHGGGRHVSYQTWQCVGTADAGRKRWKDGAGLAVDCIVNT